MRFSLIKILFGCRHKKMSSPFTRADETYCTCIECGAHRKFDVVSRKNTGPYYHDKFVTDLYEAPSGAKKIGRPGEAASAETGKLAKDDQN